MNLLKLYEAKFLRLKASGITTRIFSERKFHPSPKILKSKQRRGSSPETVTIEMRAPRRVAG